MLKLGINMENAKPIHDGKFRMFNWSPKLQVALMMQLCEDKWSFVNSGFLVPLGFPLMSLQLDNSQQFAKTLQFGYDCNGWPWIEISALVLAMEIENESFSNSLRLILLLLLLLKY